MSDAATQPRQVVVVTGISGAGKSTALRALEDAGFETVDNLPVTLLPAVVAAGDGERPVAVGIDVRTRDFDAERLLTVLDDLKHAGIRTSIVFLDADTDVIGRRYTESRRPHPLAEELPVAVGIELERRLLAPLRERAGMVLDTSRLLAADLKRLLLAQYAAASTQRMRVFLVSFGYRHGLPRDADLVLDVRFLKNPHYEAETRDLTGLDPRVGAFIERDPALGVFLNCVTLMLDSLLPLYQTEGKSYLTVAIGCTGGQHRSVYVVERLSAWLTDRGVACEVRHRDIGHRPPAAT